MSRSGEPAASAAEPIGLVTEEAAEPAVGTAEGSGVEDATTSSGSWWSINAVLAMGCALLGLRAGLAPLGDNSFFTHLSTGRLILDERSVPTTDPYSFMAPGESWVVQSWLASVVYAAAERVDGLFGIRVVVAATLAALSALVWRLTRPATMLLGRVAGAAVGLLVSAPVWNERPQVFGLVFLVLVLLAAEGGMDPRWLVPVMWLWVNMHGGFVFGGLVLGLLVVGRILDRQPLGSEWLAARWAALGVALAVINPLGLRLLLFPLGVLERREVFTFMTEWQAPGWDTWNQRLFAVQVILTLVVLLVRRRRWRWILPTLVFAVAAATSVRNIAPASLVMVPALAHGLAGMGSIDGRRRSPLVRPAVAALACLGLVMVLFARTTPHTDESLYPVDAITWMEEEGMLDLSSRVVSRDFVGNYMHARFGPDRVRTYIDDRVDMHPIDLIDDYVELLNDPEADFAAILDRAQATSVVWKNDTDLSRWVASSADWTVVHEDEEWFVAVPDAG